MCAGVRAADQTVAMPVGGAASYYAAKQTSSDPTYAECDNDPEYAECDADYAEPGGSYEYVDAAGDAAANGYA